MRESQTALLEELRGGAEAIYLACHEDVAKDVSSMLQRAADEIELLQKEIDDLEDSLDGAAEMIMGEDI